MIYVQFRGRLLVTFITPVLFVPRYTVSRRSFQPSEASMQLSISRERFASWGRRLGGAVLAGLLWAPVLTPFLLVLDPVISRLFGAEPMFGPHLAGLTPRSLGSAFLFSFWLSFLGGLFDSRRLPQLPSFDMDRIVMDDAMPLRAKLSAIAATSLGRFLMISGAMFAVLVGLSALV